MGRFGIHFDIVVPLLRDGFRVFLGYFNQFCGMGSHRLASLDISAMIFGACSTGTLNGQGRVGAHLFFCALSFSAASAIF
jgi:hypothetical protein